MTPTAALPGRLNRRETLRLIGVVAGFALLEACAPTSPSGGPSAPPPAGGTPASASAVKPAAEQPKRGGTLRVAMAEPNPLDGHVISPNVFDSVWMAYDTLTAYDDQLKPQPMLAESWDVSSDFKQVKLT